VQDRIIIGALPPASWPLSIDTVERHLQQRFASIRFFRETMRPTGEDTLEFYMEINGQVRTGCYFDRRMLNLSDGPPEVWAEHIVWFLGLLPPGTPAVAMVEVNPDVVPIPVGADADAIRDLLNGLIFAD